MFILTIFRTWIVIAVLFMTGGQISCAQFSMSAQVPASGLFTKSQLWNLLIINPSNIATDVKVQLTLQDPQSRQILLTGTTGLISVAPGSKLILYQQAQPVQYNYLGGSIDHNPDGFLPVGNYQVCYELLDYAQKTGTLAEDCINIEVEPLSPPLLSSPEDQTVGDYFRPSFTWLPPTPVGMFFNLNYDFILTPVLQGQSPSDAIQNNIPVYSSGNLTQNFLQYPSGISSLDSGKTYAWQIVAKDQSRYSVKSEVWSFTCKKDSFSAIVNNAPYTKITDKPSSLSYAYEGILKLEYNHESYDSSIYITIANIKNLDAVLATFNLKVRYGQNFLVYDLNKKIHLHENECYEVRISGSNQDHVMRFYPKYFKK